MSWELFTLPGQGASQGTSHGLISPLGLVIRAWMVILKTAQNKTVSQGMSFFVTHGPFHARCFPSVSTGHIIVSNHLSILCRRPVGLSLHISRIASVYFHPHSRYARIGLPLPCGRVSGLIDETRAELEGGESSSV